MHLIVCVKSPVEETPLSDYDSYALEAALQLKDNAPSVQITALSLGSRKSVDTLQECLALGADHAFLIEGSCFKGSDSFATAMVLSQGIRLIQEKLGQADAVFCGMQSDSGQTAQIGPQLSEFLSRPFLGSILHCSDSGHCFNLQRIVNGDVLRFEIDKPCVLSFTQTGYELRIAPMINKIKARMLDIHTLSQKDLRLPDHYSGEECSRTQLVHVTKISGKNTQFLSVDDI